MWWVWLVVATAVAGAAMLAAFAVVLWRKTRVLTRELGELARQADALGQLLDDVQPAPSGWASQHGDSVD